MKKEKEIKILAIASLIISVLCITIAFLSISKVMVINKKNVIADARWDVHFDNLKYKTYSDAKIIKYPTLQNSPVPVKPEALPFFHQLLLDIYLSLF